MKMWASVGKIANKLLLKNIYNLKKARHYCNKANIIKPIHLSFDTYGNQNKNLESIIILHGLLGSKQNWRSIAKKLHTHTKRQIVCMDARNHGESAHSSEMTYYHMALDVMSTIYKENLDPVIIMGHSMGGRTAMLLTYLNPTIVKKLIVVDISPFRSTTNDATLAIIQALNIPKNINMQDVRRHVDEQLSGVVEDSNVRNFLLMNLVSGSSEKPSWKVNLDAIEKNYKDEISKCPLPTEGGKCSTPTLFIAGSNSRYLQQSDQVRIRKFFALASFLYIPGAGHWVHFDQPDLFVDGVTKFVS